MIPRPLEDRIVLLAARSRLGPPAETLLRDLCAADPDWPRVLRVSSQQGVFPVVGSRLMRLRLVPPDVAHRLLFEMRRIAAHNLLLTRELLRLMALLAASGVEALAFKGPLVAASLYGGLGLRQFHDLDLLIDAASIEKARRTLLGAGYRPQLDLSAENEALLVTQLAELELLGPRGIRVDLHVMLMPPRYALRLATSEVLRRAARVSLLSGREVVATVSPSDLALYLSLHGIHHRWERLEWLCDLARLADRMSPHEHSALRERARRLGHERAVHAALTLAHRVLGAPAPPRKVGHATERLVQRFERMLMVPLKADPFELLYVAAYDRRRDRVRHLLEAIFRPSLTDALAFGLPRPFHFLRWPLRPLRLGWRLARTGATTARSDPSGRTGRVGLRAGV